MMLRRLYVDIKSAVFDTRSFIDGHVLHVSKSELESVTDDPAFSRIDFDIAVPGEKCRIVNMGDIVQPMIKLDGAASTFPGIADKIKTAGSGESLMLRGVVVSETAEVRIQLPAFVEMTEQGLENSDFAGFIHLVIDAFPGEGVSRDDYLTALHRASKLLAKFLASLASGLPPDGTEEFTLERDGLDGLPRVAYLADVFCHAPFQETTVYGASMAESLPIIIHPNEILDGAVTSRDYDSATNADPTYVWQNHPIILDLYSRHGVSVNFVGVVMSNIHHIVEWKQRNAAMAASMLHHQLRADGVVITKEGGGHPQVDVGLAADILEGEYGIKTSMMFAEFLSPNNDSYGQLLFKSKYADAIVSTGCFQMITLPAVDRAIGNIPPGGLAMQSQSGLTEQLTINNRSMHGCESQMGWTRFGSLKF